MDVVANATVGNEAIFFDINSDNGFARVYSPFGVQTDTGTVNTGFGLVTGFVTGTSVPEPLTLSLFGAGLVGAFTMRRRRSKSA